MTGDTTRANTRCVPSGDHEGSVTIPSPNVATAVKPVPSAFTVKRPSMVPTVANAIRSLPGTGDQTGVVHADACESQNVSLVGDEPSAFMTKISLVPVRVLRNAMRWPSGDQVGSSSIAASLVRRRLFRPSGLRTQMSPFPPSTQSNAIRAPSGDHDGLLPGPTSVMRAPLDVMV